MLKTGQAIHSAVLVFSLVVTTLAQSPIPIPNYVTAPGADKVVLNAPYSAQSRFTSVRKLADGKLTREDSSGSDARDSQGRTYSAGERHWTYVKNQESVLGSEMLYRIEDPVANTTTRWDSSSKEVKVIHWPAASASDSNACACPDEGLNLPGEIVEKLGTKTIQGLLVEGTRMSYTTRRGRNTMTSHLS